MTQMTRPMQIFLGVGLLAAGPMWGSAAHFLSGSTLPYVITAAMMGAGLALLLFGRRRARIWGLAAACALAAFLAHMMIGSGHTA
ncbi:CHASE2 domain-containing sensor protein [Rubricella aquisinus]|uniref:CHASE2 domain-containing sensor protein n=1 Tax=Rubricella aquisinus TaxID=2028108 RepID=A0A840WXE1_9RHOB|nr:hypothetical protein [Rubricella aquisinus]MBB5515024.1 CHASE2 domain-containing sensor protein [Rubricella aquisinus]